MGFNSGFKGLMVNVRLQILVGSSQTKTLSFTYPYTEQSKGVKSGDRGGQAIVPPRPVQATKGQLIHNKFQQTDFTTLK